MENLEQITDLKQIDTTTKEGKFLFAAIAKITTESQTDKTPYEVLNQLYLLSLDIFKDSDKSELIIS